MDARIRLDMQKVAVVGCVVVLAVVLVIGGILAIAGIGEYNHLVTLSTDVDSKWANVQTVYQRRSDLIPNLVHTVEASANFEKSTLTAVIEARASATKVTIDPSHAPTDPAQLAQYQKAQDQLSGSLSRLLVSVEKYPELSSTRAFRDLQAQLEGTENRIAVAREDFNTSTQAYNTLRRSFPTVLYAGMLGFKDKPFFAASADAQNAPTVSFPSFSPPAASPAH
jgi:LemA protein